MKQAILNLVIGQSISLILSTAFIFNQLVSEGNIFSYLFPNELVYHLLLLISIISYRSIKINDLLVYLLVGTIDYTSNYVYIKSFHYTSAESAVVFNSFSAILVVPFQYLILKTPIKTHHIIGTTVCLVGLVIINVTKIDRQGINSFGLFLAFLSAIGFAINPVLLTRLCDNYNTALSSFGFVSSLLSIIVCNLTRDGQLDRDQLIDSTSPKKYFVIGYIFIYVLYYMFQPMYIKRYDAVSFQLHTITTDLVVYLFNYGEYGTSISLVYLVGYFVVIVGLVLYSLDFSEKTKPESLEMQAIQVVEVPA
ncbi:hypothetical protein HDV06_006248 [Boothiomyces sp. JEL0866]|nr:hypothetical protein HDV06_006248 [Boothiomyces sp. JEL0866]